MNTDTERYLKQRCADFVAFVSVQTFAFFVHGGTLRASIGHADSSQGVLVCQGKEDVCTGERKRVPGSYGMEACP